MSAVAFIALSMLAISPCAHMQARAENGQSDDPTVTWAYVVNGGLGGSVSVIDAETHMLITRIPIGVEDIFDVAVTPDGRFAYVSGGRNTDSLFIIRTSDNTLIDEVTGVLSPHGLDVTPDGVYLYVASRETNEVAIVRLSDKHKEAVAVGFDEPIDVAITADGEFVYVVGGGFEQQGNVAVFRTSDNSLVGTVSVGITTLNVATTPDGIAYVTNYGVWNEDLSGEVSVVAVRDNEVELVGRISADFGTRGIDITPDGQFAYVGNRQNEVFVIETSENTVLPETVSIPDVIGVFMGPQPRWVAVTPDGKFAYVTLHGTAQVAVISTTDNELTDLVNIGPSGVPADAVGTIAIDIAQIPFTKKQVMTLADKIKHEIDDLTMQDFKQPWRGKSWLTLKQILSREAGLLIKLVARDRYRWAILPLRRVMPLNLRELITRWLESDTASILIGKLNMLSSMLRKLPLI